MKKILALLALILVFVLVLVSCGGKNSALPNENGGENNGNDVKGDNTEGDENAENAGNTEGGDNIEDGKNTDDNSNIGGGEDVEHIHSFGKWIITKEATCITQGKKERSCLCGEKETKVVDALGHNIIDGDCASCFSTCKDELVFTSNGDGTCSVSGMGSYSSMDLIIPSASPDGDSVTNIADNAFRNYSSIVSVKIPDSVITIGNSAFGACVSLVSVEIPDSVTFIGDKAFNYCMSLASIEIPSSVSDIGDAVFLGCSLTEINVSEENSNYKDIDGNLYSKDGKILIQYAVGKHDVKFVIPNGVTAIGAHAFSYGSFSTMEIPSSVTDIGSGAFSGCNLDFIHVSKSNNSYKDIEGNLYSKDGKTLIQYAISKQDKSFTIPDGVITIDYCSFAWCKSLVSVEIPDSVTYIDDFAFNFCTSLYSIETPKSVTVIGDYAFSECHSLIDVVIAEDGKFAASDVFASIGDEAFANCSSLASVVIGDSVTSIGSNAFYYCYSLTEVYYTGSEAEWAEISIGSDNDNLKNATIHYNYVPEE